MNKSILIAFTVLVGLVFSSCKNTNSENERKGDTTIPVGTKNVDYTTQTVDDELADKVRDFITTQFLTEADTRAISEDQRKFQLYKIDLNDDGKEEVFVNFMTPYFCGSGGCTVLLLNSDLELITRFSPTRTIYVDETIENGWRVLLTRSEGEWRKLGYENGTYPSNPTMLEITSEEPSQDAKNMFDVDSSKPKTYSF